MEYYKFSSSFIIFHHLSVPPLEISKNDQVNAVNAAVQEANSSKEISPSPSRSTSDTIALIACRNRETNSM